MMHSHIWEQKRCLHPVSSANFFSVPSNLKNSSLYIVCLVAALVAFLCFSGTKYSGAFSSSRRQQWRSAWDFLTFCLLFQVGQREWRREARVERKGKKGEGVKKCGLRQNIIQKNSNSPKIFVRTLLERFPVTQGINPFRITTSIIRYIRLRVTLIWQLLLNGTSGYSFAC